MTAATGRRRGKARSTARHQDGESAATVGYVTAGVLLSVLFILPLLWAVLRSFQQPTLVAQAPSVRDFTNLTLANYRGLIGGTIHILRNVVNSLIVAAGTGVLTAILATLAGYGFARFRFRGAGVVFALIIVTLMVPFQAILTPLFMELNTMHLTNSLLGLVFFYTTFNLPFGVFVMRNTFAAIPKEIEESAYLDGASPISTLVHVLGALVAPGIATTVLYAFLFAWTEFLGALTFITQTGKLTLPVALLNVETGAYGQVNFGYLIAGAVIAMVPCVILYVALQRYYVRGLTSGALKT